MKRLIIFLVLIAIVMISGCVQQQTTTTQPTSIATTITTTVESSKFTDSDKDGVPDYYDSHPQGGSRYIPKIYEFEYADKKFTIETRINEDLYDYYRKLERPRPDSFMPVINEPIHDIIVQLKNFTKNDPSLDETDLSLAFIQSLPYVADAETGFDEYPKYPIETIIEGDGDCEDTAYLSATILSGMNFGVAMVRFPTHMAIALACSGCSGTYYNIGERKYYYWETTGIGWKLGELPESHKGLTPEIYRIESIVNPYR